MDELSQLLQGAGGRVGVLLLQRDHQPGDVREQLEDGSSPQIIHRALTHMQGNEIHPQAERTVNRSGLESHSGLNPLPYELNSNSSVDFRSANAIDLRGFHVA